MDFKKILKLVQSAYSVNWEKVGMRTYGKREISGKKNWNKILYENKMY